MSKYSAIMALLMAAGLVQADVTENYQIGGKDRQATWRASTGNGVDGRDEKHASYSFFSATDPDLVFTVDLESNHSFQWNDPVTNQLRNTAFIAVSDGVGNDGRLDGDETVKITVSYVDPNASLLSLKLKEFGAFWGNGPTETTVFTDASANSHSLFAFDHNDPEVLVDYSTTGLDALTKDNTGSWSMTVSVLPGTTSGMGGFELEYTVAQEELILAVDFSSSDILTAVHYEAGEFVLDLAGVPSLTEPEYTGQPIYAGLKLDPIDPSTNSAAMSFSGGAAKLQWNGPGGGDDTGLYEEDDVSTGVFMFKKEDFMNGMDAAGSVYMHATNDTLSATVDFDPKVPQRLKSGSFRWVVLDAGQYYISDTVTNFTASTGGYVPVSGDALDISWNNYDPETSANAISSPATPTLQDIDALGFWLQATVLTNDGVRAYPRLGVGTFSAEALGSTPASLWNGWISGFAVGANSNLLDHGDSDAYDNLQEYAWGGDPSDGDDTGNSPTQAALSGATNVLEYIYFERDDAGNRGLTSSLEVGTDLVNTNWADGSPYLVGSGASGIPGYTAVTNWIPTDAEGKQFIKLDVQYSE